MFFVLQPLRLLADSFCRVAGPDNNIGQHSATCNHAGFGGHAATMVGLSIDAPFQIDREPSHPLVSSMEAAGGP